MLMEDISANRAPFARGGYIPQKNGKVKRFDERAEHFADWKVMSSKKTGSLAVNNGAGRG
jgi:hypothetical protein